MSEQLLDGMKTINRAWYTREEYVSPIIFQLSKEQKVNERDYNMAKIMKQLDIISKKVMGEGTRSFNTLGVARRNVKHMKFNVLYS